MKICFAMLAAAALISSTTSAFGALHGAVYLEGSTSIASVGTAAGLITGATPDAAFSSTLVNSTDYNGGDGYSLKEFLSPISADAAGAWPNSAPLGSFVMDLTGYLNVSISGSYAFTTNSDDGSSFYINGNGTPGSGTALGEVDGQHGPQSNTTDFNLVAGHFYAIEYIYYNSACCGYDATHDYKGGGAYTAASITGPGTVSLTPEPASMVIWGAVGLIGFGVARRRRAA